MHPCAAYLDEVEGLLAREELALESEDGETLDACAERRATALSLAWELRAGYEIAQLRRRLAAIPGVGIITATALVATVAMQRRFARRASSPPGWG